MTRLPFHQVDAFVTGRPFSGNPAAVMPLEAWLDDATLQAIAAENNLSETAFTVPTVARASGTAADYELRWFTPTTEVALCGHATLAAGHVLLGEREAVRFATRRAGTLVVRRDDLRLTLDLPAWGSEPGEAPGLAEALGTAPADTWLRSGDHVIARFGSAAQVRALSPDFSALRRLPFGRVLFIATAPGDGDGEADIVSRVFAPGAGIDEDPVTGSAHALLAPFWAPRLGRERFVAHQASARGGLLDCRLDGERVVLGGACVTVIEGWFALPG